MKYTLSKRYPGKRAFITGAASGLGKALAEELALDGWTLGLADIDEARLGEVARHLSSMGAQTLPYLLDVSDRLRYQEVARDFLAKAGGIDLLFNNAGVGDGGNFDEYALDDWEWMVRINQMSVVYGCHIFLPAFKRQRSGHIINTASLAAVSCAPGMGAYNMTKAAVVAISETLYGELMEFGVDVSCIQPAYFRTNIIQHARGGDQVKKMTAFFLEKSGLEAITVATEVLHRAGNRELYIILPEIARKAARLKRLAPTWFRKKVVETYQKAVEKSKRVR